MSSDQADQQNPSTPEPGALLPRGRHGIPPEEVERHQRDRIVAAVAAVMAEDGYAGLTVDGIIRHAHVSRTTFYRHFPDKREAVIGSHALIFARFLGAVEAACGPDIEWHEKVKAGIDATVTFADAEPAQAHLLAAGFLAADSTLARRVRDSYERLAEMLREGRRAHASAASLPPMTELGLVGGIAATLARLLADDAPPCFGRLRSELTIFALIPYLGLAEAARVASRA